MAKNATVARMVSDNTPAGLTYIETVASQVRLPWSGDMVDVSTIPPQSIAYLIAYGTSKTGQDAASGLLGRAKEVWQVIKTGTPTEAQTKAFNGWCRDIGTSADGALAMGAEEFGRSVANHASTSRWADVMAGKMDIPGTVNRLTGLARLIRDLSEDFIRQTYKGKGMKLPTAEHCSSLATQFMAKGSDKALAIQAEAERQMAAREALASTGDGTMPSSDEDILAMLANA